MGGPVLLVFLGDFFFFYQAAQASVNKGVNWWLRAGILMKKLPFLFWARLLTDAETESRMEGAAGAGLEAMGRRDGSQNRAVTDG